MIYFVGVSFFTTEYTEFLFIFVIQTTEGRKNLGNTHFMFPRFFASL